jgi:23S rRNA (guanosine2251-2'-O)-methyltransferase
MPVLEALLDPRATVRRVVIARRSQGDAIERIVDAASEGGVRVEWADPARVTRLSRNGRHDQGVVAEVDSPGLSALEDWIAGRAGPVALLLLDGVTNPANVGMIIRTAAGAGLDGVVLPRAGCPELGPLVVKASAGVALSAPVLQATDAVTAATQLGAAGVELVGLARDAPESLWDAALGPRVALVLGNETSGISPAVAGAIARWCAIPLSGGVDSLNVAAAAAVAAFELGRRRPG